MSMQHLLMVIEKEKPDYGKIIMIILPKQARYISGQKKATNIVYRF